MRGPLHLVLASENSAAKLLRAELHGWLLGAGINGVVGSEIVNAVHEAFVNAVEHPRDRATDEITVGGELSPNEVVVRVLDDGHWSDGDSTRQRYGYLMIEACMDSVEVERGPAGTSVTLRRSL